MTALLAARDLRWQPAGAKAPIVDGVSLAISPGEFVGILGGSGCGKTSLSRMLAGLRRPDAGTLAWKGAAGSPPRGAVSFVFQDPFTSLNPRKPLWWSLTEAAALAAPLTAAARRSLADELLVQVGLPPDHATRFPHQLSGGQRQRIAIGRALATQPELLILDEPTSALDLSVQARILNLLLSLQASRNIAMVMVSHDIAVIRHMAHRVLVMDAGRIVESGEPTALLAAPRSTAGARLVANFLSADI
ncbi:MAG: dipeptide/oligopeptide/nickel ABC transporter ATP-binding protein [Alphaproteobacteria bacterium]|nr:dipeptide/oligopeptide/nickel ABC transporter ATP-binding protein [Alphaproteobacteria bacterium]